MRLTVDVAGEVLGRPADLEELLLELSALRGVHQDTRVVQPFAQKRLDPLVPQHFLEHRAIGAVQDELVSVLRQGEPAVAVHRVGDVHEQGVGHGIPAVRDEGVDDLLGVVSRGAGIPQAERSEPVGVHVLGRAFQLGKRCDGPARRLSVRVVDLEQECLVALNDQGSVSHGVSINAIAGGSVPARDRSSWVRSRCW